MRVATVDNTSRWWWYVLIGVALVIVLVWVAIHVTEPLTRRYDKWVQLVLLTVVCFGYLLKLGWRYRKKTKFWGLYSILLFGHAALFLLLFSHGPWPILLLAVVGSIEIVVLATLITLSMRERL